MISNLQEFVKRKTTSYDNLKYPIGKLENLIIILKMIGNFINNMYALEIKSSESDHNIRITKNIRVEEADLHIKFLEQATTRISINLLVFQEPNYINIGDAYKNGLEVFHAQSGVAWT